MTPSRRRHRQSALLAIGALTIGALGLVEHFGSAARFSRSTNGDADSGTVVAPPAEPSGDFVSMSLHETPRPVPEIRFEDGEGRPLTLADFWGKVVLLNIWATWCGPCRREMPMLDRLQAKLGGSDFEVVALSIDREGIEVVTAELYAEVGVGHLAEYIDVARQLNAVGVPTTLLIDRQGREIGRHLGPAEWDTPAMVAFFRQYRARDSGALWPGAARKWAGGPPDPPSCLNEPSASTSTPKP